MKYSKLTFMFIGLMFSCFSIVDTAKAEGSRSYISPSGSDNRQCTRSQPCRTFDGALAKTDANGEIIALETATYDPTTITKSITLTAAPHADVVIRSTNGAAVTIYNLNDATVVLRGLKLSGGGKNSNSVGVSLTEAGSATSVFIENCLISDFGTGINAVDNDSGRLGINNSVIRNNNIGLMTSFSGSDMMGASATHTRFEHNEIGVKALSGKAIVLKQCVAAANSTGFLAGAGGSFVISDSLVTKNQLGIDIQQTGHLILASSIISSNNMGVFSAGSVNSMGNNMFNENDIDRTGTLFIPISGM